MITTSAREIIRNASDLSNSTNSAYLDFQMATSLLNREYKKLYDQIVTESLDFTKEITLSGGEHILPEDCYLVISVHSGDIPLTRAGMISTSGGGYYIRNNVIHLPKGGTFRITYSVLPDTITAPDKAIKLDQEDIPTDGKKYYVTYENGTATFTENKTNTYLNKKFEYDLATEQTNPIWAIGETIYNADLTEAEIPAGEPEDPANIGHITIDEDEWYYKGSETTTSIVFTSDDEHYFNDDFSATQKPQGTRTEHFEIVGYLNVFHQPTSLNLYNVDSNFYTSTLEGTTEPAYTTKSDGAVIGQVRKNADTLYQKDESDWYEVTGFSTTAIYHSNTAESDASVIAVLEAASDLDVTYYAYTQGTLINGWVRAVPSTIGQTEFFTYERVDEFLQIDPPTINDTFDVAYLDTLTFPKYYREVYVDYAKYYTVIGLTPNVILHADNYVEDVDKINELEAITPTDVFYVAYIEQIAQKFLWNDEDVSELIARDEAIVTNIQIDSPYMTISYSDGLILIYTGWNRAVWNYNCIFGHDTNGTIIALKTDDTTGKGCVWFNSDDGNYYFCSFVPDTILNYPTSALFSLLEYRIAASMLGLLNMNNDYLIKTLLPEAECEFYKTLHYGNTASRRTNYNRRSHVWVR